jgi:hypothetical protein
MAAGCCSTELDNFLLNGFENPLGNNEAGPLTAIPSRESATDRPKLHYYLFLRASGGRPLGQLKAVASTSGPLRNCNLLSHHEAPSYITLLLH